MATAAFKSTSKRSPVGAAADAGSCNRAGVQRRSRSLSRFSGRFPPAVAAEGDELPGSGTGDRFANTARGSGFPEISLDDLADEFFGGSRDVDEMGRGRGGARSGRRLSDAGFQMDTESSRRRGRSVSRKGGFENNVDVKGVSDGNARRRRSLSVARHRCSDSESYSSTLTDDEAREFHVNKSGTEKAIRTVYTQKKTHYSGGDGEGNGLCQAMHKEVRHAVEEIRAELEKFEHMQAIMKTKPCMRSDDDGIQTKASEVFEVIAEIRRNYTTELEESEKRKQELLVELAAEEQRGQELTKIVRELLPDTKQSSPGKPSRFRKRSNDRTRMSKHLSEEADKYFVDFISNVEETDISSFDGEKSDGSSSIGGMKSSAIAGTRTYLEKACSLTAETDGLILPWLEWDTCNDGTPLSCHSMNKTGCSLVSGMKLFDSKQEACGTHDDSMCLTSSHGSWSPDDNDNCSTISKNKQSSRVADAGSHLKGGTNIGHRVSSFKMDDYIHLRDSEDFLFEGLQQRQRIESGGLVLCRRSFLSY